MGDSNRLIDSWRSEGVNIHGGKVVLSYLILSGLSASHVWQQSFCLFF